MLRQTTIDWENLSRHIPHSRACEPYGDWPHILGGTGALNDGKTQRAIRLLIGAIEAVVHPLHPSQCDAVDGDAPGCNFLRQRADQVVHSAMSSSIDAGIG